MHVLTTARAQCTSPLPLYCIRTPNNLFPVRRPRLSSKQMLQTTFLNQNEFFSYVKQSRFVFLPQIHDASPRVSTQALAHDVPVLMNQHISGGWK